MGDDDSFELSAAQYLIFKADFESLDEDGSGDHLASEPRQPRLIMRCTGVLDGDEIKKLLKLQVRSLSFITEKSDAYPCSMTKSLRPPLFNTS